MKSKTIQGVLATICMMALVGSVFAAKAAPKAELTGDPYELIVTFEANQSRAPWMAIEADLSAAKGDAAKLQAIEAKLLAALQSPKATKECKGWVCRELRLAGTEASIAPLAALLTDKDLSVLACITLTCFNNPKADDALRDALGKTQGDLQAGIAQALGSHRDLKAVPLLIPLIADKHPAVAGTSMFALGQIGGAEALAALQNAKVPDALVAERDNAILMCADRLLADGKPADASAVYHATFKANEDTTIRTAALRGILRADKGAAAPVVLAVLKGKDAKLQLSLTRLLREAADASLMTAVQNDLPSLPVDVQASLLSLARDKSSLPAAIKSMESGDAGVRAAAIEAVGRLGGVSEVEVLLAAASKNAENAKVVTGALVVLNDSKVNAELVARLARASGVQVGALGEAMVRRNVTDAVPALLQFLAACKDDAAGAELAKALAALATAKEFSELMRLTTAAASPALRNNLADAMRSIAARTNAQDALADIALSALQSASADNKPLLLQLLGASGNPKALPAIRAGLADADAKVKDVALRALADWPADEVAGDLLKIAQAGKGKEQILALRGYMRLAAVPGKTRTAGQTVEMFTEAGKLASRQEDKVYMMGQLGNAPASAETLNLAMSYLENAQLKTEAALAAMKIAESLVESNAESARAAADKVAKLNISKAITSQANQVKAKVRK